MWNHIPGDELMVAATLMWNACIADIKVWDPQRFLFFPIPHRMPMVINTSKSSRKCLKELRLMPGWIPQSCHILGGRAVHIPVHQESTKNTPTQRSTINCGIYPTTVNHQWPYQSKNQSKNHTKHRAKNPTKNPSITYGIRYNHHHKSSTINKPNCKKNEVWSRRFACESPGRSRPARTLGQSGHQSTGRSRGYPSSLVWHFSWLSWGKWWWLNRSNRKFEGTPFGTNPNHWLPRNWLKPMKKRLVFIVRWDHRRVSKVFLEKHVRCNPDVGPRLNSGRWCYYCTPVNIFAREGAGFCHVLNAWSVPCWVWINVQVGALSREHWWRLI